MRRPFRFIAHAVAIAALAVCAAAPAAEAEPMAESEPDNAPSAEAMSLDLFLVRPLSLVGTVLGTAVFIVSTPFCLLAWNFEDPARRLVVEPAKYTFARELGDLD
jgi:hypothetical protein